MSTAAISTAHLFRELHAHLLTLLRSLAPDDWTRPTVCSEWTVKDITSHLLDGQLRRLSAQRDGYVAPGAPRGFANQRELVDFLHRLNAQWTQVTQRLSPAVLIELLAVSGPAVATLFESADPQAPALYAVAWAGDEHSPMWFDMAREFTEWWHHQRQIADAAGRPTPIDEPRHYHPVLETFFRALPYTFRDVPATVGTTVVVEVVGPAGGVWSIERSAEGWAKLAEHPAEPTARACIPQEIAWRIFTKRRSRQDILKAYPEVELVGDRQLAGRVLEMVSIMA